MFTVAVAGTPCIIVSVLSAVFRQGDEGKAWYVIMQGAVSVETYSKGVVETLYDGDDFGGLALIHNVPRYTVYIRCPCGADNTSARFSVFPS